MFEDLARNLVIPHQLGMTTVLVVPDGSKNVVREDWELEGRDAAHVDHVTDDLTGFLERLTPRGNVSRTRRSTSCRSAEPGDPVTRTGSVTAPALHTPLELLASPPCAGTTQCVP